MAKNKKRNDDIIRQRTFLPLIDVDPDVVVRRLKYLSWHARAQFFSNIAVDSLEAAAKILNYMNSKKTSKDQQKEFMHMAAVTMGNTLSITLDKWHASEPANFHAACIFAACDSAARRLSARYFFGDAETERQTLLKYSGLMVLRNIQLCVEEDVHSRHILRNSRVSNQNSAKVSA